MSIRTFSLNSREFHEAVCEPRERPWIPNGALPREPRWPKADDGVWVRSAQLVRGTEAHGLSEGQVSTGSEHGYAETHDAAVDAFDEWRRHVEAGRVSPMGHTSQPK